MVRKVDAEQKALEEFIGDKQKGSRLAAVIRELHDVFKPAPAEPSRAFVLVISVQDSGRLLTVSNVSTEFTTAILEEAVAPGDIEQLTPDLGTH